MKKIELVVMKLRNFKGIQSLDVKVDRKNARIYGDNATGKTTVFDAFLWLLFDKNSQNKKDFAIKTLTSDNKEVHNLEHTVEANFVVDGVPVVLKKVFKEIWKKKRGAVTKEFDGHKTYYFIDDVPSSKKEYTTKVSTIVEEETFKLLTSPSYFNEQVKWQECRNILLAVCGDISDDDVIASDVSLSKLNDILSGKSIDDMKRIIASKKKQINDELEKIPVRIDEISKTIPDLSIDVDTLNQKAAVLESEIEGLKTQKHNVLNGAAVLAKQNQLQELDMQLNTLKRNFENDSMQKVYKLQTRIQEAQSNVQIIKNDIRMNGMEKDGIECEIKNLTNYISNNEQVMGKLRKEFAILKAQEFIYEDKCECPTCKQELPKDQVEAVRAEALAQFNERISKRKGEIREEGPVYAKQNEEYRANIQILNDKLATIFIPKSEKLQSNLMAVEKALSQFNEKLKVTQSSIQDVTTSEAYKQLASQKQSLESEITLLKNSALDIVADINASLMELEAQKKSINTEIAQLANVEFSKQRIAQLEQEQQNLAAEYEVLEGNLFLIEEFTRKKVNMLTERINSKFKKARFKLFEQQINGGLNEVCETLYEGVPYGAGLNNAAKINVGLDIINTLSEHFGFQAPIFVDNAESVTKFIDVNAQIISLVVSEQDKQLRIELEENKLTEAI